MYEFLAALPAMLGITGFVIYLIIKKSVSNDPVINSILEKLKYEEPSYYKHILKLTPSEKSKILINDAKLREKVSEADRKIINRVITTHYRTNIFVYVICSLLLISGVYLYIRPKPLTISSIQIQNAETEDYDLIVDIDPIVITWISNGNNEAVEVVLENIQTGKQSERYKALASDGQIKILADDFYNYDKILSNRTPNESNRIRAIIYSDNESFNSKPFELKVGVKIICYPESNMLIFNAIVDQYIIDNFHFAPQIALFKDKNFNDREILSSSSYQSKPTIIIDNIEDYSIENFILDVNPRDIVNNRIFRTNIQSVKEALLELKSQRN